MKAPTAHLDLLVPLVSVVLLAQPDPLVSLDDQDLRDPLDPLERRVDRVKKDPKALPVEMVSRDLLVCLAQLDLSDPQERMETRERLESQVRREVKETKESMVHLVLLVPKARLERLVLLELMESPVPEVSRVCLARREMKDPEGSMDPLAQWDCRDYLVQPARKEKPETLVRWVLPVLLGPEAPPDPQELTALRDLLVVLETLDLLERRVTQVKTESLVFRENLADLAQEESEERRESPVLQVLLDPPALKVPLEMTVLKEVLVQVVSLVILVPLARSDRLV